jgi:hypothetical protein
MVQETTHELTIKLVIGHSFDVYAHKFTEINIL